ncbi:neural cell adhesion molecule 1-like isoform X2 [Exaiptasia diaphana]|uniref:Ig-like domain-containing protein n=1 Tax=Exaiptasia diaphana TaxID=2652724 RepID=A0A913XVA0_EXADI|nr:neural cell adhesion molecule 1-like isoform X2 [Exaiptasia diaphana]
MISNHITGYNERVGNAGTIYSKQNTSCGRGAWLFIIIEMWLLSTGVQCFQWIAEPSNHTITESGKNVSISWRYVLENGEQPISSKIYNDGEKTITIATMNILKKKYLLNEEYDGAAKAISENSTVTLEFFFIKKNLADKEFCIHMAISVYRATKEFSKEYRSCTKLSVYVHPRIVYHSHNIIKPNGSTVELKCNATGDPEPSITWTKVTNNSVLTNSSLMTVNITQQAFGEYCCIADNKYANDTYCITIGDPLLSNTAPTNYTMINNSVTIICLATGIPIPTIEWTNLSGNIIHQSKDGNYTIPFKQCKNETWTYYCRAWSITGKTPNKKISVYVNTMMQHCKQTSTGKT